MDFMNKKLLSNAELYCSLPNIIKEILKFSESLSEDCWIQEKKVKMKH